MLKRRGCDEATRGVLLPPRPHGEHMVRIPDSGLTSSGLLAMGLGAGVASGACSARSQLATSFAMKSASPSETLDDCESDMISKYVSVVVLNLRALREHQAGKSFRDCV